MSDFPTNTLLKELSDRIGVSGILSQLYESREADLLSAVQTFPGIKKLLPNAPFEDLVEECSNRVEGNADVITACNGKLIDFVANAVAKDAVLERTTSALISKSNGKEILKTLFKSVLDHL